MKKTILSLGLALSISAIPMFSNVAEASEYKVQKGDSLYKIAVKYNTSVTELKKINNLTSDSILVGQVLQTEKTTSTVKTATQNTTAAVKNGITNTIHTVVSGDTLGKIAPKYNLTVQQLKDLNGLKSDMINLGQKLIVKQTVAPTNTNTAPTTNTSTNVSTNVSATTTTGKTYTVVAGDTIGKIATKTGVSQTKLFELNNLTKDSIIYVGQVLKLKELDNISRAERTDKLISELEKFFGVPYVWGGITPKGFDCSGLLYYVFQNEGIEIPRTSIEMSNYAKATPVALNNLQVGDFLYFETSDVKGLVTHVGMYIGNGQMIHASTSKGVKVEKVIGNTYWEPRLLKANRMF